MSRQNKLYKRSRLIFLIAYLAIGIALFPFFRHELNPDALSYYSIAGKYAHFNIIDAINAYWSPLISWLLVPLFWLQIPVLIAARILMIIIGLGIMYVSEKLIKAYTQRYEVYIGAMICITAFTATYSSIFFSADTLFVFFSLLLLYKTIQWQHHFRFALHTGVIGVLLYYTKAYGLPFFILTMSLFFLQQLIVSERKSRKKILVTYAKTIGVLIIGVGLWAAVLSISYGYFTLGTAAKYNHSIVKNGTIDHPTKYLGLIPPPNESATSGWEDVSYIDIEDWDAFSSSENMKIQLFLIRVHLLSVWHFLKHYTVLSTIIIFLSGLFLIQRKWQMFRHELFRILILGVSLVSGYILVLINFRYTWTLAYLLVFAAVFLYDSFHDHFKPNKAVRLIIGLILIITFTKGLYFTLDEHWRADENYHTLSAEIREYQIKGKIASVGEITTSFCISFLNGYKYYGDVSPVDDSTALAQINQYQIDYIFLWKPFPEKEYLGNYTVISDTIKGELLILERQ
ncbi:MAG: hypothetical protein C0592_05840 [Marinilabiliales bacterium]|nr:MAG: hypothetical protein C0592_05840 [Marinilabiliales bacterium]